MVWSVTFIHNNRSFFAAYCISIGCVIAQDLRKILSQCAIYLQDLRKIVLISPMRNICTRFVQDCTYFPNAHYMHRLYFFSNAQYMRKICGRLYLFLQCAIYAQDLREIVLISLMSNICTRFAQDCTSFPNAQYMCKTCARLYLFLQCAIYAQDCTYFSNAQDLHKIVLLSPMCKDCRHYWKKYVTYHISALNLEWYSLHSYFWIATGFDVFLNKHI